MLKSKDIGGIVAPDVFKVGVALGKYPGWRRFRKFGMNDVVVNNDTQEMWPIGTPRVLPTAAAVASVTSSSANDTAAGSGMRTMMVQGLDADYNEVEEEITLNGTSAVTTTQTFLRINRMYGTSAGVTEWNEGNITATVGGNAQAYIEDTEGQTHQTGYTVPAGHTLLVDSFVIRTGRMAGSSDLHVLSYVKPPGENKCWRALSDLYIWQGAHRSDHDVNVISEKWDIKQVIRSSTGTQCTGVYSGYLVENSML